MSIEEQIQDYISKQSGTKRTDMETLHTLIAEITSSDKLWFLDGTNSEGKIVSNPNIGYGTHMIKYADGKSKEFYRIGLSANTTGISVYIMGIEDKNYLPSTYGKTVGKASISGYCIKFKALKDIDLKVLKDAIRDGIGVK